MWHPYAASDRDKILCPLEKFSVVRGNLTRPIKGKSVRKVGGANTSEIWWFPLEEITA